MKTKPLPRFLPALRECASFFGASLFFALASTGGLSQTTTAIIDSSVQPPAWQTNIVDGDSTESIGVSVTLNPVTRAPTTNYHRYIQVGTGLNYRDNAGVWQPAQELIEVQPDGTAAALHGEAKAFFSPNLNTLGAVSIVSSSNRTFKTHLLGLYFYDAASGARQLISGMRDCSAEVLPPNQLVYRSAFQSIQADVRFTYTKSALESDVILLQRPNPPETYGMTSTNGTIRMEVWHEYLNPPTPTFRPKVLASIANPALRSTMVEPDLIDQTLDFGDLWYPLGRIYFMDEYLSAPTNTPARIRIADPSNPKDIPVAKRWAVSPDGSRTFLIESVPWLSVKPQLDLLPPASQGARLESPHQRMFASGFSGPPRKVHRPALRPVRMARAPYKPKGVCWDYITVSGSGDYTFANGNTYFFDSNGYFSGTLTFAPNACLKFSPNTYLLGYGSFVFSTDTNSPPTIFTSKDDDLFGSQITGSTGIPTYAASQAIWPYYLSSYLTITQVRIRWAHIGVQFESPGGEFDNSSLELCQTGLYANSCSPSINNSTQCGVTAPVNDPYSFYGALTDICSGDSDGNGLPDVWEYKYFGHTGVDPNADPDGDGLSNLIEYQLGTNPTKPPVADTNGVVRFSVYTPLK